MSRTQQDQFIDDDEEETCPLCVEEFDLTDKGFRPCPCGYQICQFCYHNVKTNMNGLCPACRRPYDDSNIEYKVITAEETAAHKARQAQRQKKTQQALQKEKQKAEADHLSRKHLAGLRVVQKNLVYVTGLQPTTQEDQLLQTLRGEQYFGQYGKIIKIVVSKAKDPAHPNSVGVYVTYERKEDAQACIVAVNGSRNGERTLRAQFGTTKYCSAYLRGETCMNRNCMFLHEPGEANESYSRADLSALNAGSSQHGDSRPPPPQSQQPLASAAQPMVRQQSSDRPTSPGSDDRPALPSHASWASKAPQLQTVRTESRSTSRTVDEHVPAIPEHSTPPVQAERQTVLVPTSSKQSRPQQHSAQLLVNLVRDLIVEDLKFVLDVSSLSQVDLEILNSYSTLFDNNGSSRKQAKVLRDEARQRELDNQTFQDQSTSEQDDNPEMSGSLQLGGEPEERQGAIRGNSIRSIDEAGVLDQRFQFGGGMSSPSASDRALNQQRQQQQLLLQTMKSGNEAFGPNAAFQGGGQPGSAGPPGHQRNVSRYSFANDSSSASMSVKPVANQKVLNQQASMMPPNAGSFGTQQDQRLGGQQFFTSNVQGPPPGLKTAGTPPVSGGMTFGQGHGFATGGLQYGTAATRHNNAHDDHMRSLLRGQGSDAANKHDIEFPPLGPPSRHHSVSLQESRHSTPPVPPGFEGHAGNESRHSTPSIPPGFSKPLPLRHLDDDGQLSRPGSRPSSRASLRRQASQHVAPALPLRTSTPTQSGSSALMTRDDQGRKEHETPTKSPRGSVQQAKLLTERSASTTDDRSSQNVAEAVSETGKMSSSVINSGASGKRQEVNSVTPATSRANLKLSEKRQLPIKPESNAVTDEDADGKLLASSAEISAEISNANAPLPAAKSAPRTLRVVPTPKTETPPPISNPAATSSLASRQISIGSSYRPATPSSEHVSISDNVSVTSTSMSRANSPPPGGSKVGTAPLRAKTKSQMKKDRVERAKAMEEDKGKSGDTAKTATLDEPAQEAIVSRKKKTKKEKDPKPKARPIVAAPSSPAATASVPQSPAMGSTVEEPVVEHQQPEVKLSSAPEITAAAPVEIKHARAVETPPLIQDELSPPPTPTFDPAAMIQELKALNTDWQKDVSCLFRTPTTGQFKPGQGLTTKMVQDDGAFWTDDYDIKLEKEEVDGLLKGTLPAIRYGGVFKDGRVWDRGLVSPSGAVLRAMTEEQEARFLELERAIRETPEEFRFRPTKPQNETKFPSLDLEALKRQYESSAGPNRGVSVMEQMVQDGSTMKKGAFLVDEASKYINEFIMPPATPPQNADTHKQRCAKHGASQCPHCPTSVHGDPRPQEANRTYAGIEILERQLAESRKAADEKELLLKRVIKKNKKILGVN